MITMNIEGDLRDAIARQVDGLSDRLAGAVRRTSESAAGKLRGQTRAAGLGAGLEKAWRMETYPQGRRRTLRPAALIYSRSPVLHEAFMEGAAIVPRRSRFLVIALDAAIKMGFGHTSVSRKGGAVPGERKRKASRLDDAAEALRADIVSISQARKGAAIGPRKGGAPRARIVLFPSKARPGALLAVLFRPGEGGRGTPLFLLLRATRAPRLLDFAAVRAQAMGELRTNVTQALEGGSA
ncbi:hypothetical protein KTR66_04695 [Roseococcus sp. SDR]|uniref:DUF6441 family protein n=1 Tax=Roseococcus sp. SDR TaxID=2835532 RepID=UPI001BCC7437|nr:DUF6441 family protein [Roseococcus sp. SDR]MBS7789278.1 hypothetical protein [Roseococcus sp. SDR]MBV1844592.1 hypothetical protein [Roseococcus sp. SDR]